MPQSPPKLTPKQGIALAQVIDGASPEEAVRAAGYGHPGPGLQWLRKPSTQRLIVAMQDAAARAALVTQARVVAELASIGFDPKVAARDRISALATIARISGYEAPQRHEVAHRFARLTDDELDSELAALRGRVIDVVPEPNGPAEEAGPVRVNGDG